MIDIQRVYKGTQFNCVTLFDPIWSVQLASHSKRRMQGHWYKSIFHPNKVNSWPQTQKTTKVCQDATNNAWKDLLRDRENSSDRCTSQLFYYHFFWMSLFSLTCCIDRGICNNVFQKYSLLQCSARLFLPSLSASRAFLFCIDVV